ncbi:MAG: hypothetical protein JWR51_4695 [Devosia sp.]|uniref:hypothetical protein n=1 Tax=Devosia sp. TaxID=1871048 RepID=UPI00261B3032|nr:hypothetical protein [Devosia sp.]MDB5531592.1 hypothetical protein [Devosia sp.]
MATLLPTPEIFICDANGNPLESGTITTLIPGTNTSKATYQDADQLILNSNPIVLDSAGRAIIYGSGSYRWIIRDSAGNLVYDQLTSDTSSGGIATGGTSTGSANAQIVAASSFSQQDGQALEFIAGFSNSGPMTVAPGGGSGIPVLVDTSAGPTPLAGGEIVAANAVLLLYEASRGAFHVVNPTPGSFTGATISNSTITGSTISTTTITLKQATDPTPTDEADMQWSTLFDNLKIGGNGVTKRFWAGAAPGAITGCTIANNVADATNDIDFAAGTVSDSTAAFYMTLGSTITKRLDATWAVGNNQGGLFSGAIANTTYHCFIIQRPDTGVVDAGFDTDPNAANRPASYTYYRRVGSIVRASASIRAFSQNGNYFWLSIPLSSFSTTNPGTSAVTATLSVPTGVVYTAISSWRYQDTNADIGESLLVTALAQADTAPSSTVFSLRFLDNSGDDGSASGQLQVMTNTSSQVRYRVDYSDGNVNVSAVTFGWIDDRGRS